MATEYRQWAFTDSESQKFEQWVARIMDVHSGTSDVRNDKVNWAPLE